MKKVVFLGAAIVLASFSLNQKPAIAMGGDDKPVTSTAKQDFDAGEKAIKAAKYDEAIGLMKKVVAQEAKNANAHNYLGFAYRKKGDLKLAAQYYTIALKLNPDHKGALEYQGEMFLMLKDLTSAQKNLTRLRELCPKGCEEREDLEHDVKEYRASHPKEGS
jgi:Flp pilus assembly protein TadD